LAAATLCADDSTSKSSSTTFDQKTTVSASQLIHSRVLDQAGQKIGDLENIVVDQSSGRAQFGIIKLTGDLADHGKYTPVPFSLLRFNNTDKKDSFGHRDLTLQTDRAKLLSASRFSTQSWPDPNHPAWGSEVYRFYGVNSDTAAVGSAGSSFSSDTGTSYTATATPQRSDVMIQQTPAPSTVATYQYRDTTGTPRPIDNGTGPDGRDTFHFTPRPWPYSEMQVGATGPAYSSTVGSSQTRQVTVQPDTYATSSQPAYSQTTSSGSDVHRVDDSVVVVQTRDSNGYSANNNSQVTTQSQYPSTSTTTTYSSPSTTTTTTYHSSDYRAYGTDRPIDNGTGPDGRDTFHFTPRPWPYQDTTDAH